MAGRQVFIFLEPGSDPAHDRVSTEFGGIDTVLIWAPDTAAAADIATDVARQGADIVELYRGFDLGGAAAVQSAVDAHTPVGLAVYSYGTHAPKPILRSATIFKSGPGEHKPIFRPHPSGGSTVVVGSPDAESTVELAQRFADDGVDLIEICGGEPLAIAARVQAALRGSASVSYVVYPFDSLEAAAAYKSSFADAD